MALTTPALEPPAHVRERVLAAARKPARYTVWAADAEWADTGLPGIRSRVLAVDKVRSLVTLMIRAEPGAVYRRTSTMDRRTASSSAAQW